jgi:hypothetical protein
MCSSFLEVLTSLHITTIMQLLKKSNIIDYICNYGVYKLSYKKHIYNYGATTKQLAYFLTLIFYIKSPYL